MTATKGSCVSIETSIREFIQEHLLDEPFTGSDPLAEIEFDSLALEQLLGFLEDAYDIFFEEEDVARANVATVPLLVGVVERRIAEEEAHGG